MIYRIPTLLKNLDEILLKNEVDKTLVKNHLYKFYYIIHKLKVATFLDKRLKNSNGFINLNAELLDDLMGDYYKKILQTLIDLDIVEVNLNRNYSSSNYSSSFKLNNKYLFDCSYFDLEDNEDDYIFSDSINSKTYPINPAFIPDPNDIDNVN
jgi:hypothetical protein